jgi:endonuclease/exonuclease/phosphatase family metal-dependent hydrolase
MNKPSTNKSSWRAVVRLSRVYQKSFAREILLLLTFCAIGISAYADNSDRILKAMTRNMDTGTDLGYILSATDQFSFLVAVTNTFQESHASNIAERAEGVAAEIHDQQPDFVSLQELTRWRIGPPGDTPFTTGGPANLIVDDALQSLLTALNSLGEHYDLVAVQQNADAEAPAIFDASLRLFNVRITDFDAVLARSDLPVDELKIEHVQMNHYQTFLSLPTPAGTVPFLRGWIAVDAKLRGKTYRIIDTHLEALDPNVQAAETQELVNGPAQSTSVVVIAGDLNSDANNPDPTLGPAYQILLGAGFVDSWATVHPGDPGYTIPLHLEDPYAPSAPSRRIDLILARDGSDTITASDSVRIGLTDLTPSGLFPSDHAGVVSSFVLTP